MKKNLSRAVGQFHSNRKSGIVVAIVNIPLSISLAIACGATPVQGLITAIWGGIIAALFASNRYNIFGPAGALSGILLGASLVYGPQYLPLIAIMTGLWMLVIYISKITRYITLIPAAGLQGFLFAVGIVLLVGQLPAGLGLDLHLGTKIYLNVREIITHLYAVQWMSVLCFLGSLGLLFLLKKKFPKLPGAIVIAVLGILFGYLSAHGYLPSLVLLADKYPNISFSLYQQSMTWIGFKELFHNPELLFGLLKISVVVTIISILETIISGKITEKQKKTKFDKDKEVLGNGLVNIGCGLCGGFPATAVLVRTSLNMETGATSKVSGFLAALFTLLISALLFSGVFTYLPLCFIAAILSFIAIGIMDFDVLRKFYAFKKTSFYIILITIFLSIVEDTVVGILVGTVLALLIFLKRVTNADLNITVFRNNKFFHKGTLGVYLKHHQDPEDIVIVKLFGEINYLNSETYLDQIKKVKACKMVVFSFSQLSDIDIDGTEILEQVFNHMAHKKIPVYVTGLQEKGIKKMCLRIPSVKHLQQEGKIFPSTSELLSLHHIDDQKKS